MESTARFINLKSFLTIIISFCFSNIYQSSVFCEILNNNDINEIDFETSLNQNSVQFHEYENPETLFSDFFGLRDPLNESLLKTNFQDLSLQIDSKNVRELYTEKLLEMTTKNKKNEQDNPKWSFFNQKI